MTNNKVPQYSDIFDEQNEPELARHARNLETLYTSPELPAQLTWTRLQLQAREVNTKSSTISQWRSPVHRASVRFSLAALAMVAVLLFSSLAFAFSGGDIQGLLQKVLQAGNGGQQVFQKQQFVHIGKAKTIEGFTLTVEDAYADANEIIVSYSITSANVAALGKGGRWSFNDVLLATKGGANIPELLSRGTEPDWAYTKNNQNKIATGLNVVYFDGSTIQGNPKSIDLHTTVTYRCGSEGGGPSSETINGTTIALTPTPGSDCSAKATEVSNKLNWAFDFSLPFHAGRVVNVHQSVTSGGRTVTLERVVITQSETRLYIDGLAYSNDRDEMHSLQYNLLLGNKNYNEVQFGGQDTGHPFVTLEESLTQQHGDATFTILSYPAPANATPMPYGPLYVKGGPWIFHFIIP
jgi:hypothetical protein